MTSSFLTRHFHHPWVTKDFRNQYVQVYAPRSLPAFRLSNLREGEQHNRARHTRQVLSIYPRRIWLLCLTQRSPEHIDALSKTVISSTLTLRST